MAYYLKTSVEKTFRKRSGFILERVKKARIKKVVAKEPEILKEPQEPQEPEILNEPKEPEIVKELQEPQEPEIVKKPKPTKLEIENIKRETERLFFENTVQSNDLLNNIRKEFDLMMNNAVKLYGNGYKSYGVRTRKSCRLLKKLLTGLIKDTYCKR